VNLFDLGVVVIAALAGFGGYRLGLTARAFSWAGLAAGVVVAVMFVDDVVNVLGASSPRVRFVGALAFFVLACGVGQTIGLTLGAVLHRALPPRGALQTADRIGGATIGAFAVLVVIWLLTPALAAAPGWPARAVRGSWVARTVQDVTPDPPDSVRTLGRLVGAAPFPEVFRHLTTPEVGDPPAGGVDPAVADRVTPSVVRVEGEACEQILEGSGFFVAANLVVTNAHVVAGEHATVVFGADGRRYDAVAVAFDPRRDLALLRAASGLPALELGSPAVDAVGAVFGHPRGGPLRESPAQIARIVTARGTDIYRTARTSRGVLVLAAHLAPGDSGAPVVSAAGQVLGVAFAIDPGDETTSYALSRHELDAFLTPALASGAREAVDTGPCLVG
jgi:hypothetical protein